MTRLCYLFGFLFLSIFSFSQHAKSIQNLSVDAYWSVNLSELSNLQITSLRDKEEAPKPFTSMAKVKAEVDARRAAFMDVKSKTEYATTSEEIEPTVLDNFNAKPLGGAGIPNDNTMAISNDGIIISAINTSVTILDSDGNMLLFRTLAGIVQGQLGLLNRFYDPKVTYDPVADRFILVFLEGSLSDDTRIVVGFTETNDPTGDWNFYALNGKPLGGNTWSDYPIIAHNNEDLYITVNLLRDNESWQEGFEQSFIWQVNKQSGYDGDSALLSNLFYDIEYENKALWSICPVQPALQLGQTNMYFLSVRPGDASNDTVFLHEVTNTAQSGIAEHKLSVLKSDLAYGVPPTAYQKTIGSSLQTNDTRVLSATVLDGSVHYVQTALIPQTMTSGLYHGIISDIGNNPSIAAEYISEENQDYAYPSIAFAGETEEDKHSMMITFSHAGPDYFPGTSAIFHNKKDGRERLYSPVVSIKDGDSIINTFLNDTMERWGDYTDIQRKYNEPGIVWVCGSYGDSNGRNNVWVGKLDVNNELLFADDFLVYPNPAGATVNISMVIESDDVVDVLLTDMRGVIVKKLESQEVKSGSLQFLLHTTGISSGAYVVSVINKGNEVLQSEKILIE